MAKILYNNNVKDGLRRINKPRVDFDREFGKSEISRSVIRQAGWAPIGMSLTSTSHARSDWLDMRRVAQVLLSPTFDVML